MNEPFYDPSDRTDDDLTREEFEAAMRPTPITDAYIGDFNDDDMTEREIAMCEFARNLERQLAEAKKIIEELQAQLEEATFDARERES